MGNPVNQIIFTPKFKWPAYKYSIAIWVNWKNDYNTIRGKMNSLHTILTTFDSENNAPIYVSNRGHIGCHSVDGKEVILDSNGIIKDYVVQNGWNLVIALGAKNESRFYVGNLLDAPKFIGSVR